MHDSSGTHGHSLHSFRIHCIDWKKMINPKHWFAARAACSTLSLVSFGTELEPVVAALGACVALCLLC